MAAGDAKGRKCALFVRVRGPASFRRRTVAGVECKVAIHRHQFRFEWINEAHLRVNASSWVDAGTNSSLKEKDALEEKGKRSRNFMSI